MIKIEKVRTYSIFTGKTRQVDREPRQLKLKNQQIDHVSSESKKKQNNLRMMSIRLLEQKICHQQ